MAKPGCTHEDGLKHDCDYVEERNKYIDIAQADADAKFPPLSDFAGDIQREFRDKKWNKHFHKAMERLWTMRKRQH
jgi:hypothetical protein